MKIFTNAEIFELFKIPRNGEVVKTRRLQWLAHIKRMEAGRMVIKVVRKIPQGKKRRGRPKKKSSETVLQDLKVKGVENWKEKAKERVT